MSRVKVTVAGAAGYAGGELLRILAFHPEVESVTALSRSHGGKFWGEVHPAFSFDGKNVFSSSDPVAAARNGDVLFLALGHGESAKIMAPLLLSPPRLIVDLAADFRVSDEDLYRKYYGEHPCIGLAARFVYGLPEAERSALRGATLVANPGCMATASELCLLPLASPGLLPDRPAVFVATGSSGAGQGPKPTTHHPFRASNFFNYKPLSHQHEAEIRLLLSRRAGRPITCRMIAHSAPLVRGIHAAAYIASDDFAGLDVRGIYAEFYREEPFVHITEAPPDLGAVAGTNHVNLCVTQTGPEVLVTCVLDNLMKGAAGQAVQNMNIALGFAEDAGLRGAGFFPY